MGMPWSAIRSLLQIDPDHKSAHLGRVACMLELGRYDDAVKCYDEVLRLDPEGDASYHIMDLDLLRLDRTRDAARRFLGMLRQKP